jgi:hypothetical protein
MMAPAAAVVMPVTAEDEPLCGFVRRDQELGATGCPGQCCW